LTCIAQGSIKKNERETRDRGIGKNGSFERKKRENRYIVLQGERVKRSALVSTSRLLGGEKIRVYLGRGRADKKVK